MNWHRLRHKNYGGATEFVALVVRTKAMDAPKTSNLQRGIKHFFDAGIRSGPPPRQLPAPRDGQYYAMSDRLVPGLYILPVLCLPSFHASGLGYRALSIPELAAVHEFPRKVMTTNFPISLLALPPCQLLSVCLEPTWKVLDPLLPIALPSPIRLPPTTETYIPSIHKFLSHDWIDDTLVTATARKALTSIWNKID